jgi:hypothetical protein
MAKAGSKITPAHLSFLAIFSPNLSSSDETFDDQIVYYYSHNAHKRRRRTQDVAAAAEADRVLREEENEKLRQIGLAQGLVGFAKSFSGGENVDSVETEKSRIVMSELEKGWWVLAVHLYSCLAIRDLGLRCLAVYRIDTIAKSRNR